MAVALGCSPAGIEYTDPEILAHVIDVLLERREAEEREAARLDRLAKIEALKRGRGGR